MTDFDRLKKTLSKLRAKERALGEPRTLRGSDSSARLASLLTEIDETILPRRLRFQWDDGPGIQLAVSNRRLQGVLALSDPALSELANKPVSDPEASFVEAIKDALLQLLDRSETIKISSVHLGKDDLGSDAGIAAEVLARQWGVSQNASGKTGAEDALSAFLEALGDSSRAWLCVTGEEVTAQHGSEGDIARLGDTAAYLLDAYLNRRETLFGREEPPFAFGSAGSGEAVYFVDTGAETVFVLSDADGLGKVAACYQRSFT